MTISRPLCIVVADDITGAAEMAGIAHRHCLRTQLLMWTGQAPSVGQCLHPATDVLVIATDTRSGSVDEAEQTTRAVAGLVNDLTAPTMDLAPMPSPDAGSVQGVCPRRPFVFKKTDSALRGHIAAEAIALSAVLGCSRVLLIAQNPSRGRIIADGTYYVDGVPLAETAFRYDPEFPATTSCAATLVRSRYDGASDALCIADATTQDEVASLVNAADDATLVAGAADCFEAYIHKLWGQSLPVSGHQQASATAPQGSWLIVCGSTQSRSLANEPFVRRLGAEEIGMTDEAFHGGASEPWLQRLMQSYQSHGSVVLAVGHPSTGGREYAVRLRLLMAEAVARLASVRQPDHIVIEGGATAFALLGRLGWQSFEVSAELGPGIVCVTYSPQDGHTPAAHLILKPGSYPWGNLFSG